MKKQKIAKYFCSLTVLILLTFSFFSFFQTTISKSQHFIQKEYKFDIKDKNSSILFNENEEEIDLNENDDQSFLDLIAETTFIYSFHLNIKSKTKTFHILNQSKRVKHLPTWLEIKHIII